MPDEGAVGSGQNLRGEVFDFVFRKDDLEFAVGVVETGLNAVCDLAGEWSGKVPEKTREQATPTDGPPAQVLPIPCVERVSVKAAVGARSPVQSQFVMCDVGEGEGVAVRAASVAGNQHLPIADHKSYRRRPFPQPSESRHHLLVHFHPKLRVRQPDLEEVSQADQGMGVRKRTQHSDELIPRSVLSVEVRIRNKVQETLRMGQIQFNRWGRGYHGTSTPEVSGEVKLRWFSTGILVRNC